MIPIVREPDDMGGLERCCFCHQATPFWTALQDRTPGQQVACCSGCAGIFETEVVPTKREWCDYWDARYRMSGRVMP